MKYRIYLITTEGLNVNGFVFFTDEIKTLNVILKNNKVANIEIQGVYNKADISINKDYEKELEIIEVKSLKINNQDNTLKKMQTSIFKTFQERFHFTKSLENYLQKLKDYKIRTVIIEKIKINGNEIDIYSTNKYSQNILSLNNNSFKLEINMENIEYREYFLEKEIKIIEKNMKIKESLSNYTYLEAEESIKTFKSISLIYGCAHGRGYLMKKAKINPKNIYIADYFLKYFNDGRNLLEFKNSKPTREIVLNNRHDNIPYNLEEIIYDEFVKSNKTLKLLNELNSMKQIYKFFEYKTIFILHKVLENGGKIYFSLDYIISKKIYSCESSEKINLEKELARIIYNRKSIFYDKITSAELRSVIDKYDKCPNNLVFMLEGQAIVLNFKKIRPTVLSGYRYRKRSL